MVAADAAFGRSRKQRLAGTTCARLPAGRKWSPGVSEGLPATGDSAQATGPDGCTEDDGPLEGAALSGDADGEAVAHPVRANSSTMAARTVLGCFTSAAYSVAVA
jgi:hypothetical protein